MLCRLFFPRAEEDRETRVRQVRRERCSGYRALRCSVGSEPKAVKRRELRPRSTQG